MNFHRTLAATLFVLIAAFALAGTTPASARGGGANLLSSPGYQRALEESRKKYAQPYTQPATVYPGRTWRHRHRRHLH